MVVHPLHSTIAFLLLYRTVVFGIGLIFFCWYVATLSPSVSSWRLSCPTEDGEVDIYSDLDTTPIADIPARPRFNASKLSEDFIRIIENV